MCYTLRQIYYQFILSRQIAGDEPARLMMPTKDFGGVPAIRAPQGARAYP